MAKQQLIANWTYSAVGFPVHIKNVRTKMVGGHEVMDLNFAQLEREIALLLVKSEYRLSGNQIKFLRKWAHMSQRALATFLAVSQVAVVKWEGFGNKQTTIDTNTERMLRLYILNQLGYSPAEIIEIVQQSFLKAKAKTLELNAEEFALAA